MTVEERFEKMEAGIRDLIVVSRTVLTSIEGLNGSVGGLTTSVAELRESVAEVRESVAELRDGQKRSDELLNALLQAQAETEQKVSRGWKRSTGSFAIAARTVRAAKSNPSFILCQAYAERRSSPEDRGAPMGWSQISALPHK
jgi:hypothetical protein